MTDRDGYGPLGRHHIATRENTGIARHRVGLTRTTPSLIKAAAATRDRMIREELLSRLRAEPRARPSRLNVIVHDGTVELWGRTLLGRETSDLCGGRVDVWSSRSQR